jgi:hypothetical protein
LKEGENTIFYSKAAKTAISVNDFVTIRRMRLFNPNLPVSDKIADDVGKSSGTRNIARLIFLPL